MARGRMIAKTLSTSRKYGRLHEVAGKRAEFCQALYPLLVAHADDFGRLPGDVYTVKHAIIPTSPRKEHDLTAALAALHLVGLIQWYEVGESKCIQITNFDAHQQGLHKRSRSAFPGAPGKFPEIPSEEKGTEQKGTEENKSVRVEPLRVSAPADSPMFLEFPTVGKGGSAYQLSEAQVAEWAGLFPTIDVKAETRKALAWVLARPNRRKTAGGMPGFLVGWLNRATDGGVRSSTPVQVDRPDLRGHYPPCRTNTECLQKVLAS
jgi:hypothetical protein